METWYGLTSDGRQPPQPPDTRAQMRREALLLREQERAVRRGRPLPRTLRSVWQAGLIATRVAG
jgi:hypothetical protein